MFQKILVANRGEIALRVICACKELGISTVAVYSEADRNALHVRFADEAVCIGPPRSSESYLNIPQVISAADQTARSEAQQAFGTPDVYAEKFLEHPRHIEFQVLGDQHGKVIHLGERECSIQRRHQKLVEESPSPVVEAAQRKELGTKVVKALEDIGYTNAGTVEFLMDQDGALYFIEMNTRIQVEHPVTELVTGVDLIKAQIRIAAGEKMESATGAIMPSGHAIECRINAEDPVTFVPSAGRITTFQAPGGTGVRVDSAAYADAVIPPYYDSMIAKLIVKGRDRTEAIGRMKRALEMFVIEGIKTSIPLHRRILADPDFAAGKFDTHFIERLLGTNGK